MITRKKSGFSHNSKIIHITSKRMFLVITRKKSLFGRAPKLSTLWQKDFEKLIVGHYSKTMKIMAKKRIFMITREKSFCCQ